MENALIKFAPTLVRKHKISSMKLDQLKDRHLTLFTAYWCKVNWLVLRLSEIESKQNSWSHFRGQCIRWKPDPALETQVARALNISYVVTRSPLIQTLQLLDIRIAVGRYHCTTSTASLTSCANIWSRLVISTRWFISIRVDNWWLACMCHWSRLHCAYLLSRPV